jgi:hypothetical protein
MTIYYAEIEYTTTLLVRFEMPGDETPTSEDALEAVGDPENHRDSLVGHEVVNWIEEDESE